MSYWKDTIFEIFDCIDRELEDVDSAMLKIDDIQILFKNIRIALQDRAEYKEALDLIDKNLAYMREKSLNIDGFKEDFRTVKEIVKREIQ